MQQTNKRSKISKESAISDIATSVFQVSESLKLIGKIHKSFLSANEVFVKHIIKIEAEKTKLNSEKVENSLQGSVQELTSLCRET